MNPHLILPLLNKFRPTKPTDFNFILRTHTPNPITNANPAASHPN